MNYALLAVDPKAAIQEMVEQGRVKELQAFTRHMVEVRKISLVCRGLWRKRDIENWMLIGEILSNRVVFNPPSGKADTCEPYLSKSIYRAHFRCAHLFTKKDGSRGLRLGCLVNKKKLNSRDLPGFEQLVSEYNFRVKQKYSSTYEIISMREWMEERGVSLV